MYSFTSVTSLPEIGFDLGPPSTSGQLQRGALSNMSWERRHLRKHRRRADDEGCSAKRRRLMVDEEFSSSLCKDWPAVSSCPPPSSHHASPAAAQPCQGALGPSLPQASPTPAHPEMEIEAAQRRLQEIEDRITLEDDDDDEDLDVEPAPRRPVLVMSDSLREDLQRGISDILPHTVAQSVSHSCMELVVWRPPGNALSRRVKDSLQKQRKQQAAACHRQPPAPCTSPTHQSPLSHATPPPANTYPAQYRFPDTQSFGEEDMEL